MNQEELLQLIAAAKAGDREAQERLVMAVQNKVYYHCKKYLKNEEDAQDATQDVLISMLTNLDKLREPAAFWGWLNRITANRCKQQLIREPQEWQIPEDEEGNSMLDSMETLDEQSIPDHVLDTEETRRLVMEIIDGLPVEQRMSVVFFYYDEMSVKDIAQAMGVSENTVKSRLNYARKAIKLEVEKLEKKGTKLYSVSFLPFLAYFLRVGAETQTLPPAAAAAITRGTLEAVGSAGTAGASAASTAGTTATASSGTSTAAAAGAKAAGAVSVKLIAGVLAGVLAVGGIVAVATRSEPDPPSEPSETVMAATTPEPVPEPSEEPTPDSSEEPRLYAEAYAAKVVELSEEWGAEARFSLLYIGGADVPKLIASTEHIFSLYDVRPNGDLLTMAWSESSSKHHRGHFSYKDKYYDFEIDTVPDEMTAQEMLALLGGGPQGTAPGEETTPDDENRVVLRGTLNIYTYNEVLALQGISDPDPDIDHGEITYQLIVLDTPQTLSLLSVEGGPRPGKVSMIATSNMEQYAGQHLTFSIDLNRIYWPSGVIVPVGEPTTNDIRVLN